MSLQTVDGDDDLPARMFEALAAVWQRRVGPVRVGGGHVHYEPDASPQSGTQVVTGVVDDSPRCAHLSVPYAAESLLHEIAHYIVSDAALRQAVNYGHSDHSESGPWSMCREYAALIVEASLAAAAGNVYLWLGRRRTFYETHTDHWRIAPAYRSALLYDTDGGLARVFGVMIAAEALARASNQELIWDFVRAMQEVTPTV